MKYVLVIGDGMADNPVESLGGKTPLEYLEKPAIDALASAGEIGSVKTCPDELEPGSATAFLSIFGCDPLVYYTGRAPLEAAATGIALNPGDIAYRCNMVTLEDADKPFEELRILSHSAGSIEGALSDEIVGALFENPEFRAEAEKCGMRVYPAHSFRHIAVQRGAVADGMVLAPPHDHLGKEIGALLPHGSLNAGALRGLMRLSHKILNEHSLNNGLRSAGKMPANAIWFWAEGTAARLPDFTEKFGVTGGVISAVPLGLGIASLVGLNRVTVEGATGELDTNYAGKVDAALEVLKTHDFVAVHIEAPDECTHNGDLEGKLEAIRRIDARIVAPLVALLRGGDIDFRMLILSDHKTLTNTRNHDGEPVPFLLYDSRYDRETGLRYDETCGAQGRHIPVGTALLSLLFGQND